MGTLDAHLSPKHNPTMNLHEALQQASRAIRQLERAGVFEQMRALDRTLAQAVIPMHQIGVAMTRVRKLYADLMGRLPDFEAWRRTEREAHRILVERGWWPHPRWPAGMVHDVVALKRGGKIRLLDRLICDSYEFNRARPMRRAIERWMNVPEFRARRRLFADGLWAYRKGKYGLALTHWLPQVEGVLRGLAERQGLAQGGWKRAGRDIIREQTDHASSFAEAFLGALLWLYENSLPAGRRAPDAGAFPVRRDAILHGVDLRFGRRAHAMRVFLLLDTLHYFIDQLERQEKTAA